ncbi:microtubule-actin cross-linking factor 1-like isoform X2 [Styela clava]
MTDEKKHEQKYESLNLNLFTEAASDYKVNSHSKNVQEDKINVTERSDLEIYDNQYGFNVFEEKTNNEINMVISIDSDTDDHSPTAENVEGRNSDRLKQSLSSQTLSPDTPSGVDKIMENIDQLIQIKLAISEGNIPNDASSDEILDYVKADTMEMRKENNTTRRFQDVQEANTPEEGIHENQRLSILSVDSSADGDLVIDENTITVTEPSSSYETTENTIKLWDKMLGNRDTHYDRFVSSCPEKLYLSCTRDTAAASNELAGTQNIHSRSGSFHSNDGKFELVGISGTCKITGSSSVTSDLFRSSGQESPQKDDSSDEIEDMCLDAIRRLSLSAPEHLSRHNSRDEFDNKSTATPITTGTASPFMFSNEAQEALGDDELRYRFAFCSDNSGPTTDVESAYDRDIDMLSEEGCLDRDGILKEEDLRRAIFDAFHDLNCSHTHATSLQPGVTCDSLELVGDYDVVPTDNLPGGGNKNEGTGDPVKYHSSDDDCNFPLHHSNSKSYAPSNGILLDNERRHTLRSLLMNAPPVPILHPHASADHNTPDGDNINENASECNGTDLEMDAVDSISFTALKNHRANEASTGRLVSPKVEQETEEQPSFETNQNLNLHIQNIGEQIFPDDPDSCRDSAFYGSREDTSPDMPSLPTVTIDYFVSTDTSIQRMDGSSPDRDGSLIIEKEDLDSDNDLSMTPSMSISSFLPSETQSVNIPFSMTSKFSTSPETHVTAASSLPEYNFAQHEGGINLQNVTKKKRNKKMSRRANSKTGNETNRVAASDASQIKSKQRTITRSTSTSKRKSSPVNRKCMLSLSQTNSQVLKINEKASAGRTSVSLASSRQLQSRKSNCSSMVNSDHKITDINRKMKKKVPKQHKPNTLTFKPDDVKLRPPTRRGRDATKRRSWPPMLSDQSFKKVGLKRSLSFRDGINRINSLTNGYKDFVPLSPEKRDISRRAHSEGSVASSQLTIFRQSNKIGRLLESNRRHTENRITPRGTLRDRQPGEKYDKKAAKTQNLASAKKSTNARKIRKKDDQAQRKASSSTESFAKENLYSSEPSHVTKMSSKSSRSRSSRLYRSSCSEEGLRRQRNPSSSQDRSPTVRSRITSNSSAPSTKTPPNTRKPSIPRKSAPDFIQQNRIKSTRQKPIGAIRALGSNLQKASELSKLRRKIRAPEIKNYSSRKAHTFEKSLKKNKSPVKPKIYKAMHKRPMSGSDDTLGEASPNLPWNRTQHNYQNKENNEATILNAAERAVIRIADERDKVQKKTFTKWINKHLVKTRRQVDNLYEDLRDGHNLIALLEVLSGETLFSISVEVSYDMAICKECHRPTYEICRQKCAGLHFSNDLFKSPREGDYMNQMRLPREKGRMRFHRLQNVQIALDYLKKRKLRLVNIRNDDITDGNPKLTLGLVWTIILHFQIEDIAVEGEDDLSAKQALLLWAQRNMEGYDDIRVTNFTSSWRDGKVFNAILHRNRPDLIDMDQVRKSDNKSNLENAFSALEKEVAVTRLLDPEDVDVDKPDERSLITYVSSLYDAFPKVPPFPISITVEEWQFTWEEYRILVTSILEWIQKQIVILRRREGIPCQTVTEAKNLIHEIKLFQENELARKEADKNLVSPKYCDLEQMSQKSLGRFEIPAGYEPAKVEAAWQELMAANDEREGVLTAEYRRLEKLHNLVLKITSEASECRTKLEGAEKLIKIIEAEGDDSDQMQKQVNALLGDSEKEIRVMFVDVQTLKDAEYHQADDMYKTVFLLHEKWVALRSTYTTALKDAPNVRSAILARLRPKLQDTKEYISLQGALRWVADKTRETESFPLGDDLPKVENQLAVFKALEDEVDKFNADVRECQKAKDAFDKGSEDCKRYCQDLSQLEVNYSLLQNAVEIREGQISSLLKFIREATQHLMWLNEIEDNEINRDFTQYTSDVEPLEKQLSRMKSDVQSHDTSFKSTIHDGERLVHENHPARNTVQAYLTQLNNQWEWIQSLGYCLQQHILQLNQYQQFHTDCGKAETFLRDRESDLDEKMREISPDTEPDRAEHIFRDIFQIKEDLEKFKPTVTNLIARSKDIPCVEERPNPVIKDSKSTVQALCSYKQMNLSIAKSEECALVDKPQPTRWVVINSVQQQGEAPSAIFVIPPPSAKSISRAQALERDYLAFLELWRERHARVQLLVAINNLQRSIGYVSSWTVESYRLLSPIERDQALRNLKDGLKGIEDTESNDPTLTVKIASLRVEVQRCLKLAESLSKQMDQDDKDEEQCRTYISRLNVILRRLNTIDGVVSVRVKTALPRDVASVQHVINDHESSVVELKTIQPQYAEVREGSKQIMEREDCSAPSKEELGNQLEVVEKKWDRTWNISTLYFDKLKMVYVVVQSTKEAQNIVSGVETKIEENKEIPKDSDSLRKQQIIYQTANTKTHEMRDTLEKNHPLIVNLQRDAQKANEIGTKLVKVANTQDNKVTEDVDVQKYTADVKDVVDRWQVCKVFVDERLTKFSDLLPKAQQGEADEQRAKSLIDRLNKLLATLDSISTSQEAQMAVWLPRSVPALQQAEDSQGTVVKRVEDLKPEYDSAQTVVVNFINEETSGLAPSIPFLRDTLHKVQEKWAIVWLMTHVYFEKIKGLLYTQSAIIECEKAVSSYEKIISERSHSTTDVDALRKRNDIFQKLAADIPVHDSNFDALSKNLISTREVSHQLPPTIADKCNSDLEAYSNDIEDLQRRWEEAKSKLTMLADQVKIQLPKMEKAAAQERLLSDILSRIRALSRGLDSITQSQTARMQVSLPSEAMGLQKCQAQQKDVQNRLTDLSSDYEPLVSECNNVLEHGDLESPTATTVREECDKMTEKWILLNEITGLFYAKIKVLHDVSELMHDVNVVVVTYEQTLDANDHLPENDLNALRKQQALLKALSDNIPTHEPKFPDVSETLEIAQATTKKLSEVSDIPEQDVPQRDRDFKDLEARWEEAKKRLQQRLILLGQRIPIMEKVASEESTAASLLPGVEAFIHELERLESAQLVRADVMLPSDVNAVSRVVQQQKTTIEHFVNDVTPRYAALLAQCRPLIEKEDSTAPSVTELKKGVEKMENKWELVDHLVKSYLKKVNALLELLERLAVVRPILKTYESEVSKSRPNEKSSVEDLKACCATLQKLKSGVPVEDPKFDAVTKALKDAKDAVEKTDEGDQDIVAHEAECKEVAERWEKVKAELEIILAEVEARIPNAEKAASIEAKCKELLPSLKKLISELDSLEHAIRARIGMCMPAEPESVEKAIAQQKETSNRLDSLEPKYKQLSAEVEIILKSSDDETPSISQLKSEQKTVDKKWETVRYLSTLYIEKLDRLHDATEKARVARVTIRQYEIYLIELDTMSSDVPGLKNQVQLLEKLDKEIPQHEPEFKTLEGAVKDLRDCGDKLGKYSGIDDLDAPQYQDISDDLSQRWDEAKDQVKNRLNYARVAEAKLSEYEDKAAKQNDHLGKTENILNSEEYSKVKTTSKDIADQIKDHEGLSDDIDSQQSNMDSLVVLATEFDDAAKKYDDTAAKFEPRDAELAAKKKGSKTTTRIVVYEVTTITRKYDKLKNLISERVDRYSVDYDKAKDREEKYDAFIARLGECEKVLSTHETSQSAIPDAEDFDDDLDALESMLEAQRALMDEILQQKPITDRACEESREFLNEESDSLSAENSNLLDNLTNSTQSRGDQLYEEAARKLKELEDAYDKAKQNKFALDEGLANNLARLQQLEEEADGINEDLRKFSEEECDASQEISDEQTLESLQKQLEQIKVINAQVLASTPGVNTAIKEAENFADENKDKLAKDLADELNAAKSALTRKWEIVKEAASEMLRQLEEQAKLAQDEEQRKASISSMLSELEPMLDHVREWVSQSHTKLDTEKPAEIDEKLMAKQFEMVEEHNKFISSPQEKIANILERYKNLLESSDIKLVLAEDAVPARQNEVEDLEKERIALLDTTQKRMKSLSHAKAELAQFCQGYSPFQCWLDDANKRCRSGKQAPKDISALQAESRDISALQSEISAHNADLRFLRITSKKLVEAAKAYNDTLDRAEDKPTKGEDDVITDPTEREVEKLMTITESFYDDVVKQAHDREQLLADVLKKRATYEASLPTVYPWLDQTETQLNNIDERPLPVEPNALQIQAKEVEQILQDVTNHAATVQKLEEAARDVIALPQEALEDSERNDIKNHAGTTRKRYDDLRCKATEKSTELNSALSKSQGISERLESLLKWLDDVERQLGQNKADTVAQISKLNNSFEEANKINDSIKQRLPEVAEVKEVCSGLLGGRDGLATDSLHKRTSQLNTRFAQVEHGTSLRLGDLTELREKLAPFESNSNELSDWIESILDKLQTEDDSVPNESQLPSAELKLKEIRDEVESKRPVIIQTLREGESIVGDCRISDATPARDVMSHLSSSWEELQEILAEMEEDVTARREQMTSFEKSMADFTSWMKSVDDAVGDMKDSIVLKTLEEQIEKTQELLDSWEGKTKDLDRIYDLGSFDLKSNISPSRRRLRAHRRKNKGMRKSRARLNQKEETIDSNSANGKGPTEAQLEDINTMFEDLSDKMSDKQASLLEIKEMRTNFDNQSNEIEEILKSAESEKDAWDKSLESSEKADIGAMKNKLVEHKKWRENFLSHTNELRNATNVSVKLCEPKPRAEGVPDVQDQIKDINDRWKKVLEDSDQYVSELESSFGALGDFNTRAAQLKDWLADKRNMLNMLGATVCDRTVLATQSQQVEHLQKDVDCKKPHIESLVDVAKTLPNANEVQNDLSVIEGQWADLKRDLVNRKSSIDGMVNKVNELDKLSKEVCDWSKDISSSIDEQMKKLDSRLENLRHEETEIKKVIEAQVKPNANKVERCKQIVEELTKETSDESIEMMNEKSLAAERALEGAKNKLETYEIILKEAQEKSLTFGKLSVELSSWISDGHDTVKLCIPALAEEDLLKKQEELSNLLEKAEHKKAEDLKIVTECADRLKELCPADAGVIESKKCILSTDLDKLIESILKADQCIVELLQRLHEFENLSAELGDKISDGEKQLKEHKIIPHEARTDRHVEALKILQGELASLASQVVYLEDFAAELSKDSPTGNDYASKRVTETADDINKRFRSLKMSLDAECGKLADTVQQTENVQEKVRDLMSRLNDIEEECDQCEPVGRNETTLHAQNNEMTKLFQKRDLLHDEIVQLQSMYKIMVTNGDIMDDYNLQREVEMITRKDQRLGARLGQRKDEITRILEQVNTFFTKMAKAIEEINNIFEAESNLGTDASTVDEILRQQKEFENLRQNSFEPLQATVQTLNYNGHALVISAAPSVPTNHITDALETLERLWNELANNVNARSLNLQKALLSCGRFQDVFASLSSWLNDAEQLAASQKCPSWEYKVLLAQIEEQKVLQRMVASHQEAVLSFLRDGSQISSDASPESREKINKQLHEFKQRWETLCANVESRDSQLKSMIGDAKRFHELTEDFSEWLEKTERCHANNDVIGTQVERIQEQLIEQQKLTDDIGKHQRQLADICDTPLLSKTSEYSLELLQGLQTKIESIKGRYEALRDRVEGRTAIMKENLRLCRLFNKDHLRLFAFLSEAALRLQDGQSTLSDARPPPVGEVYLEVKEIHEQIVSKQSTVEAAMNEGKQLMMKCSGEDTIQVQEKLESIKVKYADLQSRSAERVDSLDRCLNLSQEMQKAHVALNEWLDANDTSLLNLGLDVKDVDAVRQSKSFSGEETKKLDDLIQTIHPEEYEPVLKTIKKCAKELSRVASRWGDEPLQSVVSEDESRFNALKAALQRHKNSKKLTEEKLESFYEHAKSCDKNLDGFSSRMDDFVLITSLAPEHLKEKAENQKELNEDLASSRGRVHSVSDEGESLAHLCDEDDKDKIEKQVNALESKLSDIVQKYKASSIERSLPLAASYVEAKDDLLPWIEETNGVIESFKPPAILEDELKSQQKEAKNELLLATYAYKALRDDVSEHRPYVDKLNKIGGQLAQIMVADNPGLAAEVVQSTDDINKQYAGIREAVRGRCVNLENALGESNQFFERMKALLEQLTNANSNLRSLPPVVLEMDKIKERINKVKHQEVELGKLLPTYNSIKTQGETLLSRTNENALGGSKQVVKDKLATMETAWKDLSELIANLLRELGELLNSALRFWNDAESLHNLLKELDTIIGQEVGEPSIDLVAVKQQIEVLETLCEEMSNLEKDLDTVRLEATELCSTDDIAQQPGDHPHTMEVKKVLDELNGTWSDLQDNVAKTKTKLDEALNSAVEYQEAVQRMLDLLNEGSEKVDNMAPVATELDTVKLQMEEMKGLRAQTQSNQMELERLCNFGDQAASQAKDDAEKANLKASVSDMRNSWKELNNKILARQHDLETAMLALGQLHHAINEIAAWLDKTEQHLDNQAPPLTDNPQQVEIELAKHKILWNDISAHKVTLDSITAAAHELSFSATEAGSDPNKKEGVEAKMGELNSQWEEVNAKAQARQWELEEALEKAKGHQQELDLLTRWLQDKENALGQNAPYGGLPETALEQLNTHKELMDELEKRKEGADKFLSFDSGTNQVEADLFREKLKVVEGKMVLRKAKLEEVYQQANEFHNNLQAFRKWLTSSEKALDTNPPPSVVFETLEDQLAKQKEFEDDVHSHRDILLELENAGSRLKYFSQKQDGILIKNLLLSVHARWDKVTSKTSERSYVLNECHKKAKQFYDSRDKLCDWLEAAQQRLAETYEATSDPDKIKIQLDDHKEFQRAIGSKRPVYDATTRSGKALREKGHSYGDKSHVDEKLRQLKEKWDTLCGKASERQNTLEEALMVSGRLIDAIESLLDWLYKVEPSVAADSPVHGDVHTVANLIDHHNDLLSDIKTREVVVRSLEKSSADLAESADSSWVKGQMQELSMRWEALCKFAKVKEARLGSAKAQAEEFQVSTNDILAWLSAAETNLRLNQQLPDDEFQLQELKASNHEFMSESERKKTELERCILLGNSILEQAHPDAISQLKHWLRVLQSRWDEVVTWAQQHGERIDSAIGDMEAKAALMEKLMGWLKNAEHNLDVSNDQPMPESIEAIETLIAEHQTFQDEMQKLQPDYDKLSRTTKRRPTRPDILKKGKNQDILSDDETPSAQLQNKWQRVWFKVLDRQQKLQHAHDTAKQLASMDSFSFDKWRSRYMKWMKNKKSRVMDFFRRIDTDGDGKITRKEFIDGIIKSKFPTTLVEMERVADIFDQDKDGFIDYYEFVAALHPNKESYKPATDADKIEDEVVRQVAKCTCEKRFQVQQISENKYRFFMGSQFGDNQQLRLVRILRSTVMVRVGGGWMALDEFLVKNDPCRAPAEKSSSTPILRRKMLLSLDAIIDRHTRKYSVKTSKPKTAFLRTPQNWESLDVPTLTQKKSISASKIPRLRRATSMDSDIDNASPTLRRDENYSSQCNLYEYTQNPEDDHNDETDSEISNDISLISKLLSVKFGRYNNDMDSEDNLDQSSSENGSAVLETSSHAKGRTNSELREKFILPAGSSQQMTAFRTKRGGTPRSLQSSRPTSRGSSRTASPSRHTITSGIHPTPHRSNGHECPKHKSVRSRASSGSSDRSSTPSISSAEAPTAGDTSVSSSAVLSPPNHPSRHSTPVKSSTPKATGSLSRSSAADTPRRSKIPTKGAPRKIIKK